MVYLYLKLTLHHHIMNELKALQNQELINNILAVLERRRLSQRDFAKIIGKSEVEVSRWLSGRIAISSRSQTKIEEALKEPISSNSAYRCVSGDLKVGIVGTGDMAGRFVDESRQVKGVTVISAYNPSPFECESFCSRNEIAKIASSFDELLSFSDIIYIASPISTHYQYARMAIENGRHVLCEMPFTETVTEANELLKLAAQKGVCLQAALKTAYCPSFLQVVNVAKSGMVGKVVDISATVTNLLPENVTSEFANERMMENFSYPLLMFFKLFGLDYRRINTFLRKDGERLQFTHTLIEYDDGVCSFKVGVGVKSEGSLVISGTKGYIYVPAPWWKPDYFEVRFENPADNKKYFFPYESSGLRYEIQALKDKITGTNHHDYLSRAEIVRMIEIENIVVNKGNKNGTERKRA